MVLCGYCILLAEDLDDGQTSRMKQRHSNQIVELDMLLESTWRIPLAVLNGGCIVIKVLQRGEDEESEDIPRRALVTGRQLG